MKTSGAPAPSPQDGAAPAPAGAPEPAMRGRYAVYPQEPKGAIIAYSAGLCRTCQECGCGQAQEPLDLTPGGVMKMMGKMGKLKGMIGL